MSDIQLLWGCTTTAQQVAKQTLFHPASSAAVATRRSTTKSASSRSAKFAAAKPFGEGVRGARLLTTTRSEE
jgi:hypothetical protein